MASFSNHLSVLERSRPGLSSVRVLNQQPTNVAPLPAASNGNPVAHVPTAASAGQAQRLRALSVPQPFETQRTPMGRRSSASLTLTQAQQRRRQAVVALGVATLVSIPLALFVGGIFVAVSLIVVGAAVAYGSLLVRARRVEIERAFKVRSLAQRVPVVSAVAAPSHVTAVAVGDDTDGSQWSAAYGDDHYGSDRYLASDERVYADVAN